MKLENTTPINGGEGKLLKQYSNEVKDLLGLKDSTLNKAMLYSLEVSIENILKGNISAAKSILSNKLAIYKKDPKLQDLAPIFENLTEELFKIAPDFKKSYDKEILEFKESRADKDKIAAQKAKELEDQKKVEKEKLDKEKKDKEKADKLKLAADLKRKEEEEKSGIMGPTGGKIDTTTEPEAKGIPVFITRQLRQDLIDLGVSRAEISNLKPEEAWKLLRQKQQEKESKLYKTPVVSPTTVVDTKIEEIKFQTKETITSEEILKKLNRILKTDQKKFTIIKVFTEKGIDGSTRESLKIKGEDGKTKQITSELLKKIIQEVKAPAKRIVKPVQKKHDTKTLDTAVEPEADTKEPDAEKTAEAEPVVEIEQAEPDIEIENTDPVKIEVGSELTNTKLVKKINEVLSSKEKSFTITQIWTAADKIEYVMMRGGSSKRIRKISIEILNKIINDEGIEVIPNATGSPASGTPDDTSTLDTKVDTTIKNNINTMLERNMEKKKNMYEVEDNDTVKSLRAKSEAAQKAEDYEMATIYEQKIKELEAFQEKKSGYAKKEIAKLEAESKKAQEEKNYDLAQEFEDMKKKHLKDAKYIAKIKDMYEEKEGTEKVKTEVEAKEEPIDSVVVAEGGFHADPEAVKVSKEIKIEAVKSEIVEKLKLEANKQSPLWEKNLSGSGLTRADLEKVPGFVKLSTGEQLLVLEEINQRNVTKMKALVEERLSKQQKNSKNFLGKLFSKVNFGDSKAGKFAQRVTGAIGNITVGNLLRSLGKNTNRAFIEREAAKDMMEGAHKISTEEISQVTERIKSLGLSVNEKTGEVSFLKFPIPGMDHNQASVEAGNYNKIANEFMNMANSAQHEKTASKGEFKKFEKMREDYNNSRDILIKAIERSGLAQGLEPRDARMNAMKVVNEAEKGFKYLNYTRKNPEAAAILENKANQNGFMLAFKNLAKDGTTFVGSAVAGFTLRGLAGIGGGSILGGIRGWFRGKNEVKSRYETDQVSTTRTEAQADGTIQKEGIDRFINADDQVKKITALLKKISGEQPDGTFKEVSDAEKLRNMERLHTRLKYIAEKDYAGLINRGTKDDAALNYKLNIAIADATATMIAYTNGMGLAQGIEAQYDKARLNRLVEHVNSVQEQKYENNRKQIVTNAVVQGVVIGTAGALFGKFTRGLWDKLNTGGDIPHPAPNPMPHPGPNPWDQNPIPVPKVEDTVKPLSITIDPTRGGIHMIHQFKEALRLDLKDHMENASPAEKHLLNTSDQDLAREFGLYNPKTGHQIEIGDNNESAKIHRGATLSRDIHGDIIYHDEVTGESDRIISAQNGTLGPVYKDYQGEMFHSKVGDASNHTPTPAPHETGHNLDQGGGKAPEQIDPTTGRPLAKQGKVHLGGWDPEHNNGGGGKAPEQIDPTTGKPLVEQVPTGKNPITPDNGGVRPGFSPTKEEALAKILQGAEKHLSDNTAEFHKAVTDMKVVSNEGRTLTEQDLTPSDANHLRLVIHQTGPTQQVLHSKVNMEANHYYGETLDYKTVGETIFKDKNGELHDFKIIEIEKPNVAPNPDQVVPTGSNVNPSDQLQPSGSSKDVENIQSTGGGSNAVEQAVQNPAGESFHAGHPVLEKAFPLTQNVQGIPRAQFDALAQKNVLEDLGISTSPRLLDTPENAYRVWVYENFGKLRQNSNGELILERLDNMRLWGGNLDYAESFMKNNPNNHITLALKDLEQRVYSANGRVLLPDRTLAREIAEEKGLSVIPKGITVEEYAKRLIAELYK